MSSSGGGKKKNEADSGGSLQDLVMALQAASHKPEKSELGKLLRENDSRLARVKEEDIDLVVAQLLPAERCGAAHVFMLSVKAQRVEIKRHGVFVGQALHAFASVDASVALVPRHVAHVGRALVQSLAVTNRWKEVLLPLSRIIPILQQGHRHLLTPLHSLAVLAGIKAKLYDHVVSQWLSTSYFEIDVPENANEKKNSMGLLPRDYLTFHFYAAMAFIGVKRFDSALEMLLIALTAPTSALSRIQIDAYKKYTLVSFLVHGRIRDLPAKITSSAVLSTVAGHAAPYRALVSQLRKREASPNLDEFVAKHAAEFTKDENLGLVRQACEAAVRNRIKNLTNTYLTLSLEQLAANAGLSSSAVAENMLRGMIEDREIFAHIDQRNGMVVFEENPDLHAGTQMATELHSLIQEAETLTQLVRDADTTLELDPKYIKQRVKESSAAGGASSASSSSSAAHGRVGAGGRMPPAGLGMSEARQIELAMQQSLRDQ
eukprot:TRINITY_DN57750_c0_g1_i1.p1 TRINITY_DN57750_c0_g1~~TRINITY_DN57750_c0_g1_i1.p1  ORF type:complete len:496 (-),score=262.21 TRINITY_DN57750_c0_g1_i1:1470-2936(-)